MTVEGKAVTFNSETCLYGDVFETIAPNAFDGVNLSDVRALYGHEHNSLLGRTKSGTLALDVRADGLYFELQLPNTTLGRDVYEMVQRGDLSECSFGFTVEEETWREDNSGYHRTIDKIGELFEISLVPFPAYSDTNVSVAKRGADELKRKKRALELRLSLLEK